LHPAPATVVRLTSVFGPGQVAWEGATGAIASFAARAIEGEPIVIPGDPTRRRDFVYVDDVVSALESIAADGRGIGTALLASGVSTTLLSVAELVRDLAGSRSPIQTPGGNLPVGENQSYEPDAGTAGIDFRARPLEEGVQLYVDWLSRHPAPKSRARG
jgi:UDP-glucose 4-epimerase